MVPADMDGVPGIRLSGIAHGETFVYRFPVKQSGTCWYSIRSQFQGQNGPYAALVIEPAGGERNSSGRDHVVMSNDRTDLEPARIFVILRKQSDDYNVNELTLPDFLRDASTPGLKGALDARAMWNRMRNRPRNMTDVSSFTCTCLLQLQRPVPGADLDDSGRGVH